MENQLKFNREMAEKLRKLYAYNIMDFGDFIEDSGLPIYIIDRYFNCKCDLIDYRHLEGFANAFHLHPFDLYDMLYGNKPLKGRFGP